MQHFIKSSRGWTLRLGLIVCTAAGIQACSDGPGAGPRHEPGFAEQLAHDTGVSWTVISDPDYGTPSFLEPRDPADPSLAPGATPESAAREFFKKYSKQLGIGDPDRELVLEESGSDALGLSYAAFTQQTLAGTPVFGTRLTVHYAPDGSIAFVSGRFAPNAASVSATPILTAEQAIAAASARLLSDVSGADPSTLAVFGTPRLLVYAPNATSAPLAYEVSVAAYGLTESGHTVYLVDAATGGILFEYGAAHALTGSGHGGLYYAPAPLTNPADTKSFEVQLKLSHMVEHGLGPYIMERSGSADASVITVEQPINKDVPHITAVVRSEDVNAWDVAGQGSAVDAYYYMARTEQYYRNRLGRRSYDDKNAKLTIVVHDKNWNGNAAWNGQRRSFHFGDKGGNRLPFSVDLDVIAHEFQHAVTEKTVGLIYQGQSGALNESISDIFGAFVEHAVRPGPGNTKHSELAPSSPPSRDLGAPATKNQPDHYGNIDTGSADHGGVHKNSGISNNAWYLMTIGGTNATSKETVKNPLGWQMSQTLWYAVLRAKSFAATASFKDVARATTAAAKLLPNAKDLEKGPVHAVACAWSAVGVLGTSEIKENWKVTCADKSADAGAAPQPEDPPAADAGAPNADASPTNSIGDCSHNPCETGAALGKQCSSCTGQVCVSKPECCDPSKSWTAECVTAAQNLQGACASVCYDGQSSCTHSECSAGDALPSSCSTCAAAVCKLDEFCCTNEWDAWCVNEAERSPYCSCTQ